MKRYEELTFADDYMFCKVLQNDPELCRELLELVIGRTVGKLVTTERQHPIEITPNGRGVRFDVYAYDDNSTVYDVEMQKAPRDNLPKRARYSQSLIDLEMIERNSDFNDLNHSFIIFICNFNIDQKAGLHRYAFRNLCIDQPKIELNDGTEKIFLCTKGSANDISEDLSQFLKYVSGGNAENDFTNRLENAVSRARRNPRWRKEYMDFQDYLDDSFNEGKAQGVAEGKALGVAEGKALGIDIAMKLIEENRQEDLLRASKDPDYQKKLFAEFESGLKA